VIAPQAQWSTRTLPPSRQYAQWREAVSATHLSWDLPSRREGEYFGSIAHAGLGAASLIACTCDPCSGRRGPAQLAGADAEYFGVLLVVEGEERISQAKRDAVLRPGDFALWDSRKPIEFAIGSRLQKITLLLHRQLLLGVLPHADRHVARSVSGASGGGALFGGHLRLLARERARLPDESAAALLACTLDLLASVLLQEASPDPETTSERSNARMQRVQSYIRLHLGETELNPATIARAFGISVRHLHRLFAQAGLSVERWLWQERLARCHAQLLQQPAQSISQVAFRWGFNDSAHFSRAFRAMYGMSARELRRSAMATHPTFGAGAGDLETQSLEARVALR
jgi:AraC family transcriptional activator of tynA and feaB